MNKLSIYSFLGNNREMFYEVWSCEKEEFVSIDLKLRTERILLVKLRTVRAVFNALGYQKYLFYN
jgi:hypothetical protein